MTPAPAQNRADTQARKSGKSGASRLKLMTSPDYPASSPCSGGVFLNKKDCVIEMRKQGYKQVYIAAVCGVSQPYVSAELKRQRERN